MSEPINTETLREQIFKSWRGQSLCVFPFVALDTPEKFLASAGHVEAGLYDDGDEGLVWGVRINIGFREPCDRAACAKLQTAIDRCWQWIDEQESLTPERESEGV